MAAGQRNLGKRAKDYRGGPVPDNRCGSPRCIHGQYRQVSAKSTENATLSKPQAARDKTVTQFGSGNDVGGNLIFQKSDAVAQLQLSFFQALQPQQIRGRRVLQRFDRRVEVAMFLLQPRKFEAKFVIVLLCHGVST